VLSVDRECLASLSFEDIKDPKDQQAVVHERFILDRNPFVLVKVSQCRFVNLGSISQILDTFGG
jgi:hypothetical protein